jgi:hypothetical protein
MTALLILALDPYRAAGKTYDKAEAYTSDDHQARKRERGIGPEDG